MLFNVILGHQFHDQSKTQMQLPAYE